MSDALLVLNAGSSSLKFSVFLDEDPPQPLLRGQLEGLPAQPHFVARRGTAVVGEKEWPAGTKLGPGSTGPEVALLRKRLVATDDLVPEMINGDVYDAVVVDAVKRFQARHGLEETGSVGPQTLTALNVPVKKRIRQLAASLDRMAEQKLGIEPWRRDARFTKSRGGKRERPADGSFRALR